MSKITVRLSKKNIRMLKAYGNILTKENGDTYIHIPYFFKETDQKNTFEMIEWKELSDETKKMFQIGDAADREAEDNE